MTMMKANTSSMNVLKAYKWGEERGRKGEGGRERGREEGEEEGKGRRRRGKEGGEGEGKEEREAGREQFSKYTNHILTNLVHECPPW